MTTDKEDFLDIWEGKTEKVIDYTAVKDGAELLNLLNDDGMKWATAFTQYLKKVEGIDVDVSYAFTWFANAIEHSNDYRRWHKEAAEKEALDYPPT
jgi:hypothetical protein